MQFKTDSLGELTTCNTHLSLTVGLFDLKCVLECVKHAVMNVNMYDNTDWSNSSNINKRANFDVLHLQVVGFHTNCFYKQESYYLSDEESEDI